MSNPEARLGLIIFCMAILMIALSVDSNRWVKVFFLCAIPACLTLIGVVGAKYDRLMLDRDRVRSKWMRHADDWALYNLTAKLSRVMVLTTVITALVFICWFADIKFNQPTQNCMVIVGLCTAQITVIGKLYRRVVDRVVDEIHGKWGCI